MLKNLIVRALSGAVLVALILGAVLYSPITFGVLFCVIVVIGAWEFYCALGRSGKPLASPLVLSLGAGLLFATSFLSQYYGLSHVGFAPYFLFLLYLFVRQLYEPNVNAVEAWGYGVLGQLYVALPFAILPFLLISYSEGVMVYHRDLLISLLLVIWCYDSFAYLFGVTLGRHRLFERISPKKSWEGAIGGGLTTLALSYFLPCLFPSSMLSEWQWVGFAAVTVLFSTWGDLVESLFKRTIGIKDSGFILPGHGGVLDRFDSLLLAAPAVWIYIELFIRN